MSVKRWMPFTDEEEDVRLRERGAFYSLWATFCLPRGTRPTKELKVDCLG